MSTKKPQTQLSTNYRGQKKTRTLASTTISQSTVIVSFFEAQSQITPKGGIEHSTIYDSTKGMWVCPVLPHTKGPTHYKTKLRRVLIRHTELCGRSVMSAATPGAAAVVTALLAWIGHLHCAATRRERQVRLDALVKL